MAVPRRVVTVFGKSRAGFRVAPNLILLQTIESKL